MNISTWIFLAMIIIAIIYFAVWEYEMDKKNSSVHFVIPDKTKRTVVIIH